ncbi:hypothetical protein CONLIGDRAFT_108622 [Coniochaeta ligniaria NRRL 30616]|uniref:Uncharacterized protein n=1 Tax=Coniochaeta ligniaria NRRL 30616 TaxID=1408157 RepID=A0A1J7J9V4_9PEZI|nr:hypothetical protein CONLIGDRAFT_108622 [Coniochaeta ligniaria NRRL 30616]
MPPPDFDSIWNQVFCTGSRVVDAVETNEHLRRLLPDDNDYKAFRDYSHQRSRSNLTKVLTPAITADELVQTIDTDRLLSPSTYTSLVRKLMHPTLPWIPMGCNLEQTLLYRVVPDPFGLRPHDTTPPATDHQVLPLCFLGVNETVQPRQPSLPLARRMTNLSERSTMSAESDNDQPGFAFFQIGKLEWLDSYTDSDTELDELNEADWVDSGFCVVARLGLTGYTDGIFVVADMFPMNEETAEREQITGPNWGIPPHSKDLQFSCARVGSRLRDMGAAKALVWADMIEHPVELVWLKIMGDGRAMRAMVDGAAGSRPEDC